MLRKVLLGSLMLVGLFAAPAMAQYDPLVVTPGEVRPGGSVTVTGQACAPGATVVITLIRGNATHEDTRAAPQVLQNGRPRVVVATTIADENGNFTVTFKLPKDTKPGLYTVQAKCGDVIQSDTIKVKGDAVAVPPGNPSAVDPGATGNLPRTGSDLNGLGLLGAGLLAIGGLVLLGTRKRRTSSAVA